LEIRLLHRRPWLAVDSDVSSNELFDRFEEAATMPERITIEKVTDDPGTGELVLYFVEDGPWPADPNAFDAVLKRIQDKILDAADASIDGGVAAVYPDSIGKRIRIQVDSPNGCPDQLDQLIQNVDKYLRESEDYSSAVKASQFVSGIRVVTGHMLGRFLTTAKSSRAT